MTKEKKEKKKKKEKEKVIIMGAKGRDFHNFFVYFKDNPNYDVVAFTYAQIPSPLSTREFPKELGGKKIPIYEEKMLPALVKKYKPTVVLSYSDLTSEELLEKASIVLSSGGKFMLLPPNLTQIKSKKPVVAVCATRTGAGKTTIAREVCKILKKFRRVVLIRHPMPYGDLKKQLVQKFSSYEDLDRQDCSIEEREEYERYLNEGIVIFGGINYKEILKRAEKEADVIVFEGGNNDTPLIKPNLLITVADAKRDSSQVYSYPGKINVALANVIVINKINASTPNKVKDLEKTIKSINPNAKIIKTSSFLSIERPGRDFKNKKVIVVEDGPTVTHGNLKVAAGWAMAKKLKTKIIDPTPYAIGSIREAMIKNGLKVIPALGYNKKQMNELEKTINNAAASANCDYIILGTPADLTKIIKINKPTIKVNYEIDDSAKKNLEKILRNFKN